MAGAAVLLTAGCGSASDPSPPAGVDELVIPTPSPDPDDFAERVDNPWFPLVVGATWTYESTVPAGSTVTMTAEAGPTIAGVSTTALRTVADGGEPAVTLDYFAQDDDGNVWWFGREGEWRAGEDGAEAGVAMLARPRFGDGYREALGDGVVDQRSEIVALDGEVDTPAGAYDDVQVVETTSPVTGWSETTSYYARGVGLVARDAPNTELRLVASDEPQS